MPAAKGERHSSYGASSEMQTDPTCLALLSQGADSHNAVIRFGQLFKGGATMKIKGLIFFDIDGTLARGVISARYRACAAIASRSQAAQPATLPS